MSSRFVLGVDIGGTKVAAGIVSGRGEVLRRARVPMNVTGSATQAMDCVHQAIVQTLKKGDGMTVAEIGVSAPGPLDPHTGIVLHPPNLPCWKDFQLLREIESTYGLATRIDNDANAAGLAEALWGAGRGHDSVLYATIGTGIGTAIILHQKLYYGRTGGAAEGGHMSIDYSGAVKCGCGKNGCIEGLAGGPAIATAAREAMAEYPQGAAALLKLAGGKAASVTAETVVQAWQQGDPMATRVLANATEALAVWFGNLIDLLEPEVIIVGGGLGSGISEMLGSIGERSARWSVNPRAREIPFLPAQFGVDAGIVGSAALWFRDALAQSA